MDGGGGMNISLEPALRLGMTIQKNGVNKKGFSEGAS